MVRTAAIALVSFMTLSGFALPVSSLDCAVDACAGLRDACPPGLAADAELTCSNGPAEACALSRAGDSCVVKGECIPARLPQCAAVSTNPHPSPVLSGKPTDTGWTPTPEEIAQEQIAYGLPNVGHHTHPYHQAGLRHKTHTPSPLNAIQAVVEQGNPEDSCPAKEDHETLSCTVVVLHGFNEHSFGSDYTSDLKPYLTSHGFSTVQLLAYYGGECNNDADASNAGVGGVVNVTSHAHWQADYHESGTDDCGNSNPTFHTIDTDYRHLAYHVAWYLYHRYTKDGTWVNVLTYSMGGVMIRYALAEIEMNTDGWPPELLIDHIVNLGAPHDGSAWYSCAVGTREGCELKVGSPETNWLWNFAQDPKGASMGSEWTAVGSECDFVVSPYDSATNMVVEHKVVYIDPSTGSNSPATCPSHTGAGTPSYKQQVGDSENAWAQYNDAPGADWYGDASTQPEAPHTLRWAMQSLKWHDW